MKKITLIALALVAAATLSLTSCEKEVTPDTNNDNQQNQQAETPVAEGRISFADALVRLEEIQPKGELDNEILGNANGLDVTASSAKYANVAITAAYSQDGNPDEETKNLIDSEIKSFYALNSALIEACNRYGIGITEQSFQTNIAEGVESLKTSYGDDYEKVIEQYAMMTPYGFFESNLYNLYYSELVTYLYGKDGKAEDFEAIKLQAIDEMAKNEYVRAKHILIQFPEDAEKDENGNVVESAKAETLAKAEEVLEKVNAGEDFDALIAQYNEDPGMTSNPDGYYFTKGEMVENFETTTYALEENATSGLVETPYGYHIIKKLPIAADNDGFFNSEIYQNIAYGTASAALTTEAEGYTVEYNENYEARAKEFVDAYFAELKAQEEAAAAQAEAQENTAE